MSDEHPTGEQSVVRELDRESRRLARLRLVADVPNAEQPDDRTDDFEPDPKQAA